MSSLLSMAFISVLYFFCVPVLASYNLLRDYSGASFFNGWDFYGGVDNLTLGDTFWVDQVNATSQGLAYVNTAGNVILKVDNTTTVPVNGTRNSVRITTQDAYDLGTLWIIDLVHIPYGCSVWPAFWSFGPLWPDDGEIDIIEGINLEQSNQMALHTLQGCTHPPTNELGNLEESDCSLPSGCVVGEKTPNSYQASFAAAGGGVWATQFDVSGIFMWFWGRANIPSSITEANSTSSIDISTWGTPSASYTAATCNISQFFTPQNLVLDITLCGDWAGVPGSYDLTCAKSGPTGQCYLDNVVGSGANYANAYFEISYLRTYTLATAALSSSTTTTVVTTTSSAAHASTTTPELVNDASQGKFRMGWISISAVVGAMLVMLW